MTILGVADVWHSGAVNVPVHTPLQKMKKARAINTLVFTSNLNYKRILDEFNVFESWNETPLSPRKKQKKKKTQNTFIQLSFDLCISPLPHLQWLQWGQCVYHGTRVWKLASSNRTFPLWINGRFLTSICERGDKTVFYGYQKSSWAHALTSITQLSPLSRGPKHLKHSVQVFSIVP